MQLYYVYIDKNTLSDTRRAIIFYESRTQESMKCFHFKSHVISESKGKNEMITLMMRQRTTLL